MEGFKLLPNHIADDFLLINKKKMTGSIRQKINFIIFTILISVVKRNRLCGQRQNTFREYHGHRISGCFRERNIL